ncbi:MAG TPA: hypothetical protein VFP37_00445 [Steroidobacteraceae bacterium]|nr:hypothetical protein [Steroidobacteraceae bacterium]
MRKYSPAVLSWAALLSALLAGAAVARPVTVEPSSTFRTPDPAYDGFGIAVAIDGDYAIATAGRTVTDPGGDPTLTQIFSTAFLFRRSGTSWTPVRQLEETRQVRTFIIPEAVAMRDGLAAVQTARLDFWRLVAGEWVREPAELEIDGPGPHLAVDGGRVLSGDGTGPWNGVVYERDADGTWRNRALLIGKVRAAGLDDEFRGGPADLSGSWAVVMQPDGEDDPVPEFYIFHDYGSGMGGWDSNPYGGARPPEGATRFGDAVAIRWPDVFVAGGPESGTYVYRESPQLGFELATRVQALDSFMGSGHTDAFAHTSQFLLQHAWSHDRNAYVVNVFARQDDASFTHVAVLAARRGESLGRAIAICGRRVLVGDNGNGLVHYFEIPTDLTAPAPVHDTFGTGNGAGWSTSPGSAFATATRGVSRVFRQSQIQGEARAVLDAAFFRSEAVEADVRIIGFGASGSGAGLATRYQNPQNFYEAMLRNTGRVELRRMASGTSRMLASAAFPVAANRNYRLRVESVGRLHRVLVDGKVVLEADASGPTAGWAALVTDRAQAEFDNVTVSPTLATTIYSNDFQDAAGPWTHTGLGFWNLKSRGSNQIYSQSSIAGDARASIGVPTGDQIVRARARLDTFASPTGTQERWFGLTARHVDDRNFYYLSMRSSQRVSLRKVVNGRVVELASRPLSVQPAVWYRLRLDAVGNRLRAYVNDTLWLETTDDSLPSGSAGIAMFKAATDYDEFLAYQP